jgi:hypothetical protein
MKHTATWGQNSAVYQLNPNNKDDISIRFVQEPSLTDFEMQEAALAQLQKAYGLEVSFPDTEQQILAMMGISPDNNPDGKTLFFDWSPPLPETSKSDSKTMPETDRFVDGLTVIAGLFQKGLLTEEEFALAKTKLFEM